ncbi:MAG: AmmeMemoRadiSam system protein B [Acidimicrobiales bacterium]
MRVRPPAVAGTFYPADPGALRSAVESALAGAASRVPAGPVPKAVIAPHAGYVYSAPVAASAYARVVEGRGRISRVVLVGPAHRVYVDGVAASGADAFATPLGPVEVDVAAREALVEAGLVVVRDDVHAPEHSLEVHLPFLQIGLGDVAVLPLAVGDVDPDRVADVLDAAWGGEETLVVVSTDLSHYLDHAAAREVDRRTAASIVARRPERLRRDDACGVTGVQGLLAAASRHGLSVDLLDLRTSADTAGDPDRVVGYGAFVLG